MFQEPSKGPEWPSGDLKWPPRGSKWCPRGSKCPSKAPSDLPQAQSDLPDVPSNFPDAQSYLPGLAWPRLICFFLHASREDQAKRAVMKWILLHTFLAISWLSFGRFCSFFDEMITTSIFLTSGAIRIFLFIMFQKWERSKDCSLRCKITTTYDFSWKTC